MAFQRFGDFARDRRGSVAIIFAIALIPLVFAAGMGIDYGFAAKKRSQLNAAADAAALAAVNPSMMIKSTSVATNAAQQMFNAQVSSIPGVQSAPNLTVNVKDSGLTRTAQLTYTAQVTNAFAGIYGQNTTSIGGSSSASATAAPNIDFYLLLDSSPSMAIAATTAGINTMVANTPSQKGCAFACHETNPGAENPPLGNPGGVDNYMLAKNLGVTLRIDNMRSAVQNLTTTAQTVMASNTAKYRMAIYTFDVAFKTIQTLTSNLATAQSNAANIQLLEVYKNSYLTKSNNNNDTDTDYDNAMNNINSIMPNPGDGTKKGNPQEVMFFVTDGVEDEKVGGARQQSLMSASRCATIKNRGIRIAVLYTTYFPLPTNAWYNKYIAPFQSQIGPNMRSCASPGLYFEVNTDQDISTAMNALFQLAVASAHLTK